MKTIAVAGDLFVDLILRDFDVWPQPGRESLAREFTREIGGGAAITACGLAKLGLAVQVFGVVGTSDSHWLLHRLNQRGVDISAIRRHATEPTAFTVVASTADDRAFLTYTGANRTFPDELSAHEFTGVQHIHLACAPLLDTAPALFDKLRATGCTLSLDTGWHPAWLDDPRATEALRSIDLYFPNEAEALRLTGCPTADLALRHFARAGIAKVALKRGAQGASLLWDQQTFQSPALTADTVDVTGAGDCFDAGFLYGWLTGHPPQRCLDLGNLCGALSTEAVGGLDGFPTLSRITGSREL